MEKRVQQLAGRGNCENAGKQIPPAVPAARSAYCATTVSSQKPSAPPAVQPTRPPAPRIGGYKHDDYIDWTHLDDDSPGETSSKCVQSISRKRTAATVSPEAKTRAPKRKSPDRVLYANAVPLPVALPLPSTPSNYCHGQIPQTIVDLWHRVDIPGRKRTKICPCPSCPYTGNTCAPMEKRYNCMVALVNYENWLYFNR